MMPKASINCRASWMRSSILLVLMNSAYFAAFEGHRAKRPSSGSWLVHSSLVEIEDEDTKHLEILAMVKYMVSRVNVKTNAKGPLLTFRVVCTKISTSFEMSGSDFISHRLT